MTFHVLSFVDPTALPLQYVAGPALKVFTESSHAENWLSDSLLGNVSESDQDSQPEAHWWSQNNGQPNIGILLRVIGEMKMSLDGPRVTELLLYASMSGKSHLGDSGIFTPPRSSSPSAGIDHLIDASDYILQTSHVYALPLSSELVHRLDDYLESRSPPPEDLANGHARFIPLLTESGMEDCSGHRKRLRLDSLFADATQRSKRSKRRGGESVAMAMASLDYPTSDDQRSKDNTVSHCTKSSTDQSAFLPKKPTHTRMLGMSRSHSLSSMRDLEATRPSSRGSVGAMKRSSLRRVASVAALDSSSSAPELNDGIEQQNRTALSRVVMAGMRMYGLQQKRKAEHSTVVPELQSDAIPSPSMQAVPELQPYCIPSPSIPQATTENEDEYKLIYHQTYKAASFALRKQMAVSGIGQEVLRDIVDQLLELFCTNQQPRIPQDTSQQEFGSKSLYCQK